MVSLCTGVPPICTMVSKHALRYHSLVQEGRNRLKPRMHTEEALRKAQEVGRGPSGRAASAKGFAPGNFCGGKREPERKNFRLPG